MRHVFLMPLLLALALPGQAADPIAMSPEQRTALGIELAAPEAVSNALSARYPAKVAVPNSQLQVVSAPYKGLLEMLLVAEGEDVVQGQPLARIQSPELLELQGRYLEALSRLELTGANFKRDKALNEEGIIAERRYLESRAAYRETETSVAQLRQSLELAGLGEAQMRELANKRRLSSTLVVSAPLDGVVLEQMATAGQRVDAADPLYRVGRLQPLWLEIHVPLDHLGDTAPGDRVVVPDLALESRIITVGRMVHGTDQGVLVRAEVHAGTERLRPGQFVQAQLARATATTRFRVPRNAVVRREGASVVFVAGPDGFVATPVQVMAEEARDLVISAPLAPGAQVAMRGTAALKAAWLGGGD